MAEQEEVLDLTNPPNTICVFVEGGCVQDVTGIPFGVKLLVVDWDHDGAPENELTKVLLPEATADHYANVAEYGHESVDGNGLTAEQRERYLAHPFQCPFCGTDSISAGETDLGDGIASQEIHCPDCDHRWTDLYQLVDVEAKE